jgi:deltex-like protein
MLIGDKDWFKCPVCSMIYGKMMGDQPPGKMTVSIEPNMHCDGYSDVGTIIIYYSMHSGRIKNISFPGTGRTAYLPNNIEGN